ncbi:unnamed protein product [Adineta steineri]|uniref:Uncharacterized protein n=1 Tax=Adineta steineri TaxID=433720 RepID=A0A819YSY2_9BILA|nr:unnamed protein product [Adineta steineri]CAF4160339.1 unnamed protein product [Adineta steineri]
MLKKLAQIPTSAEPTIKLKEKDSKLSIVFACNETFDMLADDDFCQILFIKSNAKTDVLVDLTLQRNGLINEYTINSTYHKNYQPELLSCRLMLVKQFHKPVAYAICNKFIWGIYHQGYECLCVTHRKCRQNIPFNCQQSINPKSNLISKNYQCESVISHQFIQCRVPFVQSLTSREHNHCNHCGS